MKTHKEKKKRLRFNTDAYYAGIFLSVTAAFMLCIFEPLCIYFQNSIDYIFDVYTLFPVCAVTFLVCAIICIAGYTIFYAVLPKLSPYALYLAFSVYVALYVQGNYFVKDLAELDGSSIDWTRYTAQYRQSLILWILVFLVLGILFFLLKKARFCKLVRITSCVMLLIFVFTTVTTGILNKGFVRKLDLIITDKNWMEYSADKNFIILVVDTVDIEYENKTLEKYPEDKVMFKDFTYYDNVVSGYGYTVNALPFLVGGKWYEYQEDFDTYNEWTYLESPLVQKLQSQKYVMGLYTDAAPLTSDKVLCYENIIDQARNLEHPLDFAKVWLRLVGYKYLPYQLKPYSQVLPTEFTEHFNASADEYKVWNFFYSNWPFYALHRDNDLTIAQDKKPRFKLLHIAGAHYPFELNRNMEYSSLTSYTDCVEATGTMIDTYLNRLKAQGVYDNSVIIILADHGIGWDEQSASIGRQDPVLFIKGFGETHDVMQVNSAPISQEDFPAAYEKLLDGNLGDSVFEYKTGDKRDRRCLLPDENGNNLVEYIQHGFASDNDTLIPTGKVFRP